ncbi:MAG: T9SS type A sorting domain-containing protein [Ignavibacteria bacterium]|nr:T9SS type A sorting domain-containing protein [Ignavibacteria bacterium]
MKKIILITILTLALTVNVFPQIKAEFYLANPRAEGNLFLTDLYVTVPSGQTWQVGPTNVRIDFYTVPAAGITFIEDSPVVNANTNLSNNTNYATMTTTLIIGGSASSTNILLLYGKTPYTFNPGSHFLGTLRFNRLNMTAIIHLNFRPGSAIFNNMTALTYNTEWTFTDPPPWNPVGIQNITTTIPDEYNLGQNFPNPFNPSTKIQFDLPENGFVSLKVYDMLGREVAVLVNDYESAGSYIVDFNGSRLSSGIYYYRIETGSYAEVRKMILLK